MEYYTLSVLYFFPIILTILLFSKFLSKKSKLPPGPKPWPIIGNIHQLGKKPHQSVAELSKIYGPIMTLKLGSITTIVISSPEIAKEMFLKHDLAFSSRPIPDGARAGNHSQFSIVWLPVCSKWRHLRKIATIQLFTNQRLDISQALRQQKVKELHEYVRMCCEKRLPVDIGKAAFTTTVNLLSNTIFSKDLVSYVSSSTQDLKELFGNLLEEGGRPNVSDFFPLVRHLDLQGVLKRSRIYLDKILNFFQEIVDERLNLKDPADEKDDVLGTLLKLVKNKEFNLNDIKYILLDLFVGGTDTTTTTFEWAMTELLRNPEKLVKAQMEMDRVLGDGESMQEEIITQLQYIHSIVKETLRLHPPGPFLIPHKAIEDTWLWGYLVPKNSSIWINVWAIGRDPSVWPNAELFEPERFLDRKLDVKGQNYELIPFGSGRRICPGLPLAQRMLHLMLATLLHSFNWKYVHEISPDDIYVEEKFGMTLQKLEPLQAIPFIR